MPFDSGNLSLSICLLPGDLPHDALERFVDLKAKPLSKVSEEQSIGWVGPRHLLDTDIKEETAYTGGYLHLVLRTAQRKIPRSLFQAECKLEELALLQANKWSKLSRKQKKQIQEEVTDKLIESMPPTLTGIDFVADPATNILYIGASSPTKLELFLGQFTQTVDLDPLPLNAEIATDRLFKLDPMEVPGLDFSPNHVPEGDIFIGRDFLTWMWYFQEVEGGIFNVERQGAWGVMVDGPLTFIGEASNALESVVRKGLPTTSAEAKAALTVGKKLKQAKVTFARANEVWSFTFDAENFMYRSLSLPPGEELDPASHFQERVMLLHDFREAFFTLFKRYLDQVMNDEKREQLQKKIQKWVDDMRSA